MTSFVLSWLSIMAERISAAVISLNFVAISLVPIPWGLSLCGAALAEAMLYCNDNTAKRPAAARIARPVQAANRSEEHTSELQSQMRISYAVLCLTKKKTSSPHNDITNDSETE